MAHVGSIHNRKTTCCEQLGSDVLVIGISDNVAKPPYCSSNNAMCFTLRTILVDIIILLNEVVLVFVFDDIG